MPKISEMFAFVVADKDADDEGIMGIQMPDGVFMPLVGADMKRVDSLPIGRRVQAVKSRINIT